MSYNNNVPQAGQTLGNTRQPINTNFALIDTVEAVNHVGFNLTGAGKHKFLQMPDQASAPTTAANEGGLYVKAVTGSSELFYRKESNGTEIQLTGVGGSIPTILTGSVIFTGTTVNDIVAIPANSWGFIIFSNTGDRSKTTSGHFFASGTLAYGYTNLQQLVGATGVFVRLVTPVNLTLRGRADANADAGTYDFKILYWIL